MGASGVPQSLTDMADEKTLHVVIRMEKDAPEDWHVAAQTTDQGKAVETASNLARAENKVFGTINQGEDGCAGNKTNFFIFTKDELVQGAKNNNDGTTT